jgi:hypothetical protein
MGAAAEAQLAFLRRMAEEYHAGRGPFPERLAVNVLALGLVWEHLEATIAWSRRAVEAVGKWQKPGPGEAPMWPEGVFAVTPRPKAAKSEAE